MKSLATGASPCPNQAGRLKSDSRPAPNHRKLHRAGKLQLFRTSFNSSSIYSKAQSQGEAELSVQMAIQYPDKYDREDNWLETSTVIKVEDKLPMKIPEFMTDQDRQTHLYMIPRNAHGKITTNRKAKLKMGYSI